MKFTLLYSAILLATLSSQTQAVQLVSQQKSYTRSCETLAGSPYDKLRSAGIKGVEFDSINVAAALDSCSKAVLEAPDNPTLHYDYGRALDKSKIYDKAYQQYQIASQRNYSLALYNIGAMYEEGSGLPSPDNVTAFKYYLRAAELGDVNAMYAVGLAYENGDGISENLEMAFKYYLRAAELGDVDAMHAVGNAYYNGDGVSTDSAKAEEWWLRAAKLGSSLAPANLCYLYTDSGEYEKAIKWGLAGAKLGDEMANNNLGWIYLNGYGVKVNRTKAAAYFAKGGDAGRKNLAIMENSGSSGGYYSSSSGSDNYDNRGDIVRRNEERQAQVEADRRAENQAAQARQQDEVNRNYQSLQNPNSSGW